MPLYIVTLPWRHSRTLHVSPYWLSVMVEVVKNIEDKIVVEYMQPNVGENEGCYSPRLMGL